MKKDELFNEQLLKLLDNIGLQIKNLGHGDATNDKHGAIELFAMKTEDSFKNIASSLDAIAKAIEHLAEVIEERPSSDKHVPD
jgi:hypothetical protein